MGKVNEIKVPIPAGCKATTEIKDGIMTVLIEKEKVKKEWKLEANRKYCFIDDETAILAFESNEFCINDKNCRNSFRHESDAKAMLAYIQLLEMYYQEVGDYVPEWSNQSIKKYIITPNEKDELIVDWVSYWKKKITFPTLAQAQQFLSDYSELIEQAKRFL